VWVLLWGWRFGCGDVEKGVDKWGKSGDLLVRGSVENLGLVWRGRKGLKMG